MAPESCLFLNVQPDYVNSHLMFPTGPESVRIVYDWLFDCHRFAEWVRCMLNGPWTEHFSSGRVEST